MNTRHQLSTKKTNRLLCNSTGLQCDPPLSRQGIRLCHPNELTRLDIIKLREMMNSKLAEKDFNCYQSLPSVFYKTINKEVKLVSHKTRQKSKQDQRKHQVQAVKLSIEI